MVAYPRTFDANGYGYTGYGDNADFEPPDFEGYLHLDAKEARIHDYVLY